MNALELQKAVLDCLLPTTNTMESLKAKTEVKVPTRFGQYFTHSSVIKEEKGPLLYEKASNWSSAETWVDTLQEKIQNLIENEMWYSVKAP